MACLIKPQFEAGKERVGKHGVVKEKSVHEDVIKQIILKNLEMIYMNI